MLHRIARARHIHAGIATTMITCCWLLLPGVVLAEGNEGERQIRLELSLEDGSRITGSSRIHTIPIETRFAQIEIPLEQIHAIKWDTDDETVTLDMQNGDRITGHLILHAIPITAIFGDIDVRLSQVKSLRVTSNVGVMPAALKQSMVLHYTFEHAEGRTIKDKSPQKNHGTLHNGEIINNGKTGGGLKLNGENSYVHIPNSESLEIRNALTICTWVKINSFGPGGYGNEHGFLISKGNSMWWNPTFYLGYAKDSGSSEPRWPAKPGPFPALFHVCNTTGAQSGGGKQIRSETLLHTGKWYHIAGTYDGEELKIYINGKHEATAEYSGLLRSDSAPVFIGGSKLGGTDWGNHFTTDATIDEVMIFNKALSGAEIQSIYHAHIKK